MHLSRSAHLPDAGHCRRYAPPKPEDKGPVRHTEPGFTKAQLIVFAEFAGGNRQLMPTSVSPKRVSKPSRVRLLRNNQRDRRTRSGPSEGPKGPYPHISIGLRANLRSARLAWAISVSGASHNPAMKLRRLRDGDVLEDGDVVLVRGGDLDPDILCADAVR